MTFSELWENCSFCNYYSNFGDFEKLELRFIKYFKYFLSHSTSNFVEFSVMFKRSLNKKACLANVISTSQSFIIFQLFELLGIFGILEIRLTKIHSKLPNCNSWIQCFLFDHLFFLHQFRGSSQLSMINNTNLFRNFLGSLFVLFLF